MSTAEFYKYEPLPKDEPHIRLITLLPQDKDGMINLRLDAVRFFPILVQTCRPLTEFRSRDDRQIPYKAVSYTWGSDQTMHTVRVNGKFFKLRENIWNFLDHCCTLNEHLSPHDKEGSDHDLSIHDICTFKRPRKLWIDSISINQHDLSEKSDQVSLMGKIFDTASETLIWLGKNVSSNGILGERFIRYRRNLSENDELGKTQNATMRDFLEDEATLADMRPGRFLYDIIAQVVSTDYWKRLWIVQEVLLKFANIVFGSYLINVGAIVHLFTTLSNQSTPLPNGDFSTTREIQKHFRKVSSDNAAALRVIEHLARDWEFNLENFGELFAIYKHQLCLEPKDKIFGLLGITRFADNFHVDYEQSLEEIVLQAIGCFLQESKEAENRLGNGIRNILEATGLDSHALLKFISELKGFHLRQFIEQSHVAYLEPTALLIPDDIESDRLTLLDDRINTLVESHSGHLQTKQLMNGNTDPLTRIPSCKIYEMSWDVADQVFSDLESFIVFQKSVVALSFTRELDLLVKWCEDGIARPVGLLTARKDCEKNVGENIGNRAHLRVQELPVELVRTMGMCRREFQPICRPSSVEGYYTLRCFTMPCSLTDIVELGTHAVQTEESWAASNTSSKEEAKVGAETPKNHFCMLERPSKRQPPLSLYGTMNKLRQEAFELRKQQWKLLN